MFIAMKNRMAIRTLILGKFMMLPVTWTQFDGMCFIDCRHFGPVAGFLCREGHSFWSEANVSYIGQ